MAKVGYIFKVEDDDENFDACVKWMEDYECDVIYSEDADTEASRLYWRQTVSLLEHGDELVLAKLSNALRKAHELIALLDLCRVHAIRLISIGDRIDSEGKLFPETTVKDVLDTIGSLLYEATAVRKKAEHINMLKNKVFAKKPKPPMDRTERQKMVVSMYNGGFSIDDIWRSSGYRSRSSVFRVLNRYGVTLNRGKFSGPLGPRKKKGSDGNGDSQI